MLAFQAWNASSNLTSSIFWSHVWKCKTRIHQPAIDIKETFSLSMTTALYILIHKLFVYNCAMIERGIEWWLFKRETRIQIWPHPYFFFLIEFDFNSTIMINHLYDENVFLLLRKAVALVNLVEQVECSLSERVCKFESRANQYNFFNNYFSLRLRGKWLVIYIYSDTFVTEFFFFTFFFQCHSRARKVAAFQMLLRVQIWLLPFFIFF